MEIAHKVLLLLLALSCFSAPALADLKLARPFTDNMVLQRELPVQIWGTAPPNSEVTVQFAGQEAATKTDKKGHWKLQLKPLKTSAKSRTLRVLSGDDEVALSNVLVGEVWLFSGQSNMGMSVKGSLTAKESIAEADLPKIRFYNSPPRPNPDQPSWVETSPKNVGGFSAVSFYFARALHRDLDVPVGMIVCARGGTMIQSWISREALTNDPQLKRDIVKAWDRTATPEYLSQLLGKKWDKALTKSGGNKKKAIQSLMNPAGQEPGINFRRSEMAKIAPFTIRGFGWYQGES
ncbi:MAG: hypothetical protein KGZ25_08685, partial [Planctomycetes bacterium]|nr:hypothetical protein [Planctomycetota bacterium]